MKLFKNFKSSEVPFLTLLLCLFTTNSWGQEETIFPFRGNTLSELSSPTEWSGSQFEWQNNKSDPYNKGIDITETTAIKAKAFAERLDASDVATAAYTLSSQPTGLTGDGTFENPYTVSDVINLNITASKTSVWVRGYIIGSVSNKGSLNPISSQTDTNIAIADDENETTTFIPVELNNNGGFRTTLNTKDNPDNLKKLITIHGKLQKYFGKPGIKSADKVTGVNHIVSTTDEGYATFYTDCAYEMPEGLTGGLIKNVTDGKLTINYQYNPGDIVSANTSLLIKGVENKTYDVVNTNSARVAISSMLHGKDATNSKGYTNVSGTNVKYYVLTYSKDHTDFGFYWAAADGAAVKYQEPFAFLAVDAGASAAAPAYSLHGDGDTTGINSITNAADGKKKVYTLTGMFIGNSTQGLQKGIYIVNGKKIAIK